VESTGNDFESEAEWCQGALGRVVVATATKIRMCAQSKGWWNGQIEERRSEIGREKGSRCRSAATAQANGELEKSISRANDRTWNDHLMNKRGADIWSTVNCANTRAESTVETLTDRDAKLANTLT